MKKSTKIWLWVLTLFFTLSTLVYLPSFSSVFSLLLVCLVVPIPKWQAILQKFIRGKLKVAIVIVLALLTIFTAPTSDSDVTDNIPTSVTDEYTTVPTTESTTEITTEPTTTPATEPTTAPTTEPTTAPTTAPTTEPPHTHNFNAATCTTPKTCSCGTTEGEANGHNWKDATCSDPKTCTVCGTTSGLTAGHNFSNGKCTTCGKADPDYNHETMVWIPTNGGTKYHTHAGCSNMEDPEQVTQSEAESRGFTPCKRCH